MAFEVENLGAIVADLRARGVTFERFEMSGFDVRGDTIAAPDSYTSKGTGELGTFFYDSEGNLIGIASRSARAQHGAARPDPECVWHPAPGRAPRRRRRRPPRCRPDR